MTRVVLDTNVYISALMFGGLPGSLLDLAFLRAFTLIVSPAQLDELDEKLQAKFGRSPEDADSRTVLRDENCRSVYQQFPEWNSFPHESGNWLSHHSSDKIPSLPTPSRQSDRANEESL